jgi:hypothetical protein
MQGKALGRAAGQDQQKALESRWDDAVSFFKQRRLHREDTTSANGACERANRTLKELTARLAAKADRSGFWTSDDLLQARLTANRLSRPWGSKGPTPEQAWTSRRILLLDERTIMWQHLKSGIAAACEQRGIDPTVALPHYAQTEIERIAATPVLEALGLLCVRRRRITPTI